MKIIIQSLLWLIPFCAAAQPGKVVDRIIGVVGNEILLQSELESSMVEMSEGKGGSGTSEQRCSLFENLIYQKLLLNQSKLDSLEVTDGEVQAQVDRRLNYFLQMFGSTEEFEKYYGKTTAQLKDEYFDLIKDQLLVQKMQDEINKHTKVTPADVLDYYNALPVDSLPLIGEQIEYSKIVLDPAVRESEKTRVIHFLDSIRVGLVSGKSSMTLEAAKWSEDPGSKYKGGCYPMQRKGSFVPEYEAAVFNTPEGTYSPVFASTYGYHFVKVIERRGEFYESCHILMSAKIRPDDLNQARIKLESLMPVLRSDTLDFYKAATRYSTDVDSKNQGGKALNLATGGKRHDVASLSSELNLVMMGLQPGEISDPILVTKEDGSQAYVVYRLDKRIDAHTANMKEDYEIFKQVTEAQAKQKETDKWVKKKISQTSISVNEEFANCVFQFPWIKNKP